MKQIDRYEKKINTVEILP